MARGLPVFLAAVGGVAVGLTLGWLAFHEPRPEDVAPGAGGAEEPARRPATRAADAVGGRTAAAPESDGQGGVDGPAVAAQVDGGGPSAVSVGPSLSVAAPPPPERTLYDAVEFQERLERAFRAATGRDMDPDALDVALREGDRLFGGAPSTIGRRWSDRERLKDEHGEIGEPVDLLLQVRAYGSNGEVSLVGESNGPAKASPSPIVLDEVEGPPAVYVRGGVIPAKKVLVVEQVELQATLGHKGTEGRVRIEVGETLAMRSGSARLRGTFRGSATIVPFGEPRAKLVVSHGAAEVRVRGRLVPEDATVVRAPLRLDGSSEGFLEGGEVRLQAIASSSQRVGVHLGGAPTRNRPPVEIATRDLWGREPPDPRGVAGAVFSERAGLIPPGTVFEVERIVWRTRFTGPNGRFELSARGTPNVRVLANQETPREGEWRGRVKVQPGDEEAITVQVQNGATGEAVVYGRLVRP